MVNWPAPVAFPTKCPCPACRRAAVIGGRLVGDTRGAVGIGLVAVLVSLGACSGSTGRTAPPSPAPPTTRLAAAAETTTTVPTTAGPATELPGTTAPAPAPSTSAGPAFIPPSRPPQPVTQGAWDFCFYMLSASVVNTYKRAATNSEVATLLRPSSGAIDSRAQLRLCRLRCPGEQQVPGPTRSTSDTGRTGAELRPTGLRLQPRMPRCRTGAGQAGRPVFAAVQGG